MTGSRGIWIAAKDHAGRYLLPRRFRKDQHADLYQAAEWLVEHQYARWVNWGSSFAPGIVLTGKPWSHPDVDA